MQPQAVSVENPFRAAEEKFKNLVCAMGADEQRRMTHDQLECFVEREGGEVLRLLLQGHFDHRGTRRSVLPVVGADGVERTHHRIRSIPLKTVVGEVTVTREVLCTRGHDSLAPLDAELQLPPEKYSFELQKRVAIEGAKGSFDEAVSRASSEAPPQLCRRDRRRC